MNLHKATQVDRVPAPSSVCVNVRNVVCHTKCATSALAHLNFPKLSGSVPIRAAGTSLRTGPSANAMGSDPRARFWWCGQRQPDD